MPEKINLFALLEKVSKKKPIVHHITNWVTIADCANVVKALGASPVMAHAPEEAADMTAIASSLVLNIGTLTASVVEAMKYAALAANKKGIPVVLDVCGAGATPFRNQKVAEILSSCKIDIIKGNASEIASLAGEKVTTRGVDAGVVNKDLTSIASFLAGERNCVTVITGEIDIVADKTNCFHIANGDRMMKEIVGTGCMATSVIATFAAITSEYALAAAAGLSCFEIAAEIAVDDGAHIGNFKECLFHKITLLTAKALCKRQKIS